MQSARSVASRLISPIIAIAFIPAGVGLLLQTITPAPTAERLLSLALFMFCIELAHMASVDLTNIERVMQQRAQSKTDLDKYAPDKHATSNDTPKDSRLTRFLLITISTIVLETTGFYLALNALPWGAVTIIFSQLWFNLLAGIQLWPGENPAITPFGIKARAPVLIANLLGVILVCLWPMASVRLWSASGLLLLITLFIIIKYALPNAQPT